YNRRASTYDADTTFHWRLAQEYIEYVKPKAGESLLDLACGTGLVTFALAPHLKKVKDDEEKPLIVGVDIADGMLERAVFKLGHEENSGLEIEFLKGDITRLDEVEELSDMGGAFDIITVCSALVLLDYPKEAIKHWAKYLKPGGRLVLDVPHPMAMLGVKVLGKIARDFGIPTLGNREWVHNLDSLKEELEDAGLDAE
ncbi:S-adenosyl-L-methionine-dependent methyltransferase, partial [Acephala macrosclerotiorum]